MTNPLVTQVSDRTRIEAMAVVRARLLAQDATNGIHAWRAVAREDQLPPDGEWHVMYTRGGRGSGKTWSAAHNFAEHTLAFAGSFAVVAPTYADARDTCVEGPSGLLNAYGTNRVQVEQGKSRYVSTWNRSFGELRLRNGNTVLVDGADDGALRVQGKNLVACWCDEVGLWKRWQLAWEESIRYAVRIAPARIIATGTPKRGHPLVKLLNSDPTVIKRALRTMDNVGNLDPSIVAQWVERYAGTALGRQELEGEVLEDVPGAAWQRDWIEPWRLLVHPDLVRITVAIDPATTSAEGSDDTGIVAAGAAQVSPAWCKEFFSLREQAVPDSHPPHPHEHYFVLADASMKGTPAEWGATAVALYRQLGADRIVGETNRGGDMIEHTVRTVSTDAVFKPVRATRGKLTRAEPIAALYQQGKVHHVGNFTQLEDEQCSYVPGEQSPDRMDALVWAMTDLAIGDEPGLLALYRSNAQQRADSNDTQEAA